MLYCLSFLLIVALEPSAAAEASSDIPTIEVTTTTNIKLQHVVRKGIPKVRLETNALVIESNRLALNIGGETIVYTAGKDGFEWLPSPGKQTTVHTHTLTMRLEAASQPPKDAPKSKTPGPSSFVPPISPPSRPPVFEKQLKSTDFAFPLGFVR